MASLKSFLEDKKYCRVKLTLTKTNHFEVVASVNNIEGRFILDTGASSTCIGFDCVSHFNLDTEDSEIKAAGAGAINMTTQISKRNKLAIGDWQLKKLKIVLFDLTHVNAALTQHDALPVHGIIGADVLKRGKAIIDYQKKSLYLGVKK